MQGALSERLSRPAGNSLSQDRGFRCADLWKSGWTRSRSYAAAFGCRPQGRWQSV